MDSAGPAAASADSASASPSFDPAASQFATSPILDALGQPVSSGVGTPIHFTPEILLPPETRRWIRNSNEQRNAEMGARFNEKRGQYTINWIESHCCLYEGRVGHGDYVTLMPWQVEAILRLFSWIRFSDDWGCWVRQYKQFSLWAPKKSGKSPFEAMIGLYMFCGEGEPGQKCYSVAFDKNQALIAHMHVVNMIWASPVLDQTCTVNKGTWRIFHHATRSEYKVVSGDKHDRHGSSKEGFNGTVLVDETHTVTNELVRRLTRAGISRREPIFMECSTAGPDLNGYGFNRFTHCEAVNAGKSYDPELLHISYVADQSTPIEDYYDEAKVKQIIIRTNPSIGPKKDNFILSLEEALNDWRSSLGKGESELRDFAMYRTNLWLHSATAWLSQAAWQANRRKYDLDFLKGYACFGGLDLSKVGDPTALMLHFLVPEDEADIIDPTSHNLPPEDAAAVYADSMARIRSGDTSVSTAAKAVIAAALLAGRPARGEGLTLLYRGKRHIIRQWPIIWLPRKTAEKMQGYVRSIMDWGHDGVYRMLNTETIDYSIVSDEIASLRESHGLKFVAYDPAYSKDVVRNLIESDWYHGDLLEVTQNLTTMSPLAQDYERGVISQSLQHPGNAMLDWMVSHCELYRSTSGLVRPIKPEYGDYKKIDAIVAGVIGLACLDFYSIDRIMEEYGFSTVLKTPRNEDNGKPAPRNLKRSESAESDALAAELAEFQ